MSNGVSSVSGLRPRARIPVNSSTNPDTEKTLTAAHSLAEEDNG